MTSCTQTLPDISTNSQAQSTSNAHRHANIDSGTNPQFLTNPCDDSSDGGTGPCDDSSGGTDISDDIVVGGGGPPPNNPTPAPPYATHTENPDDPDGPGHGPLPNLAVNFQNACPNGYVLAFSNGNGGNPNGGAYCGEDTSLTYQQILVANLIDINLVFY